MFGRRCATRAGGSPVKSQASSESVIHSAAGVLACFSLLALSFLCEEAAGARDFYVNGYKLCDQRCRHTPGSTPVSATSIALALFQNCDGVVSSAASAIAQASVVGDVDAVAVGIAVGLASSDPFASTSSVMSASLSYAAVQGTGLAVGAAYGTAAAQLDIVQLTAADVKSLTDEAFVQLFWDALDGQCASSNSPPCEFYRQTASSFIEGIKATDPTLAKTAQDSLNNAALPNILKKCPDFKTNQQATRKASDFKSRYKQWKGHNKRLSCGAKQMAETASFAVSLTVKQSPDCSSAATPPVLNGSAVAVAVASSQGACKLATSLAITCFDVGTITSGINVTLSTAGTNVPAVLSQTVLESPCDASVVLSLTLQQISQSQVAKGCSWAKAIASDTCALIIDGAAADGNSALLGAAKKACDASTYSC